MNTQGRDTHSPPPAPGRVRRTRSVLQENPEGMEAVRRNLFGPVDKEEVTRWLSEQRRQHLEEMTRKWNFDFATGRPLPEGPEPHRLRWELASNAPAVYHQRP